MSVCDSYGAAVCVSSVTVMEQLSVCRSVTVMEQLSVTDDTQTA